MLGKKVGLKDIARINFSLYKTLEDLKDISDRKLKIMNNSHMDEDSKKRSMEGLLLRTGSWVDDLCLTYTIPGTSYELVKDGSNKMVNLDNLEEFLDLLLESYLVTSIKDQVKYFRWGFNHMFEIDNLNIFKSHEIEEIICGNSNDSEWTVENLLQYTVPAHGYHSKSATYKNLLWYMSWAFSILKKRIPEICYWVF